MNLLCRLEFHKWKEGTGGYKMGDQIPKNLKTSNMKPRNQSATIKAAIKLLIKNAKKLR